MPQVSVVMPVYNGERFLAEAIESILAQTFTDFEFIIVDDGSTDSSADIVRGYQARDGRIRFIQLPENVGEGGARSICLQAAQGEFVAQLDSDDLCLPQRLQMQLDFLRAHPDVGAVGTGLKVVDENQAPMNESNLPSRHPLIVLNLFCGMLGISHGTAMMRRGLLLSAGGYDANRRVATDFDVLMRLLWRERIRYANLPDLLYIYRRHQAAISANVSNWPYPNTTEVKLNALERLWGESSETAIERFLRLRHWMKLSWNERRLTRRDLYRLVDALVAAQWVDRGDKPLLLDEIDRRLEKTMPRRWLMLLHWYRYRIKRHLA